MCKARFPTRKYHRIWRAESGHAQAWRKWTISLSVSRRFTSVFSRVVRQAIGVPSLSRWNTAVWNGLCSSNCSGAGDHRIATLRLRIDKRQELPWPHNQPVTIEPLSLSERHVVVVTSKNKRVQSFRFDFVDYSGAKLCLSFDGSELAHLGGSKSASWCSCK